MSYSSAITSSYCCPGLIPSDSREKKSISCGTRVVAWFKNHPIVHWNQKNMASTLVNKVWRVACGVFYAVKEVSKFVSKSYMPSHAKTHVFQKAVDWFLKMDVFKFLRLATICSAAYSALSFLYHGYEFIKGAIDEKIDAALKMMTALSEMGQSISAFTLGLAAGGMIAVESAAWLPGLNIASAVLSVGAFGLNVKHALQHGELLKKFDLGLKTEEGKESLFNKLLQSDSKTLERDFHVDGEELKDSLKKIKKPEDRDQGLALLRKRISQQMRSEEVLAVSSAVSVIGLTLLLFSPFAPLAVAGFACLAISSMIGIGALVYNIVSKHRFENHLEFLSSAR